MGESKMQLPTQFSEAIEAIQQIQEATDTQDTQRFFQEILGEVTKVIQSDIFVIPIAHHSVSSALVTKQILEKREPEVIFLEMSIDFESLIDDVMESTPPVSFQGISYKFHNPPSDHLPAGLLAPLTTFSSEYQAMLYASRKKIPIKFVDIGCQDRYTLLTGYKGMDGKQQNFILEVGEMEPTRKEFITSLLDHTSSSNFSEFWINIVESSLLSSNIEQYRLQMLVMGLIFRKLGFDAKHKQLMDRRDEVMSHTMDRFFEQHPEIDPQNTVFICGASHAFSVIDKLNNTSSKQSTRASSGWIFGLLETSYAEIDTFFGEIPGTTGEKAEIWETYQNIDADERVNLTRFNYDNIIRWAVDIVKLARRMGYTTSVADSIAIVDIYHKLTRLRGKTFLSKIDFMESVEICLDKNESGLAPLSSLFSKYFRSKTVRGRVAFKSLPPLARDVIDRMGQFGFEFKKRKVQRFLLDFKKEPDALEFSNLLWLLHRLEIKVVPIMGTRELGKKNIQESWDVYLAKNTNKLIELGYEGLTVEEVYRKRVIKRTTDVKTNLERVDSLIDAILYLPEYETVHKTIIDLLLKGLERNARFEDNLQLFKKINAIVNYYRGMASGLPQFMIRFLVQSFKVYCQELPHAFQDQNITLKSLTGMISFVKKFESTIVAEGESRKEFEIALELSNSPDMSPEKYAIYLVCKSTFVPELINEIRVLFFKVHTNPLTIAKIPKIIEGLCFATYFKPAISDLIAELLDQSFRNLSNELLARWVPSLITLFKEIDQVIIQSIQDLIVSTYSSRPLKLWYHLEAYRTGNFTKILRTKKPKDGIKQTSQHIQERNWKKLYQGHRQAIDELCSMLDLEMPWGTRSEPRRVASLDLNTKVINQMAVLLGMLDPKTATALGKKSQQPQLPNEKAVVRIPNKEEK